MSVTDYKKYLYLSNNCNLFLRPTSALNPFTTVRDWINPWLGNIGLWSICDLFYNMTERIHAG